MPDRYGVARTSRATMLSLTGFAIFLLLTILVHARVLARLDLATTLAIRSLASAPLDGLGTALSILFSTELSLFFALLIGLYLWRKGCGLWSLAPFALLPLLGVETVMKMVVHQPTVPTEFHHSIYYPLATVDLSGSFPSGHAARAGFLCAFLAVLVSSHRGTVARLVFLGLVLLMALVGFTRIYLGDHWLSDAVAGLIFGAALAILVASPASRR